MTNPDEQLEERLGRAVPDPELLGVTDAQFGYSGTAG